MIYAPQVGTRRDRAAHRKRRTNDYIYIYIAEKYSVYIHTVVYMCVLRTCIYTRTYR